MTAHVDKTFRGHPFRVVPESSAVVDDEEPMLRNLERVRSGDIFLDVGAGHGTYALRAAAMGAYVVAFEPHGPSREILARNVRASGFDHPGDRAFVEIENVALFDGSPYPENLRREVWGRHYPTEEPMLFARIDDLGFEKVDWLKLDVEGAELGVLRGGIMTISNCRPTILCEDHDGISKDPACVVSRYAEGIDSSRKIRGMLEQMGYAIEVLPWGCGRRFLVAEAKR
jgi:FkbM family methyltransferase